MKFDFIKNENVNVTVKEFNEGGIDYFKISIDFNGEMPSPVSVIFHTPLIDAANTWTPISKRTEIFAEWCPLECIASLARSLPILGYISANDRNRGLIALSDVKNLTKMSAGVVEETCESRWTLKFFTEPFSKIRRYETTVRFDTRDLKFTDCVKDVTTWWETVGFTPAKVPDSAYHATYSTWYNFHQNIDVDNMLAELKIAKELGFKNVIVDDGWQCTDNNRGYAHTGDWIPQVEKIGNVSDFVKQCHDLGLKVMIWYSVPFVGKYSKNYERFKEKFLRIENGAWGVLDPRYPDVRGFLINLYRDAMKNYGLDGLKLDFIDSIRLSEESPAVNDNMDIKELPDALYALMRGAYEAITQVNPDAMIEFRQAYIGPAIRSFGNMFRVTDCPYSAGSNIRGICELRLSSGNTAVHSDMLMWHNDTTDEDVARQLLATLFSVPQISVMLRSLPKSHMAVLKEVIRYREENVDVLMHGDFDTAMPFSCDFMTAKLAEKQITALYKGNAFTLEGEVCDVFFVSEKGDRILDLSLSDKTYNVTVKDCYGNTVSFSTLKGLCKVYVPSCGRVEIRPAN